MSAPVGQTVVQYGVRYGDGEIDWWETHSTGTVRLSTRDEAEQYISDTRDRIADPECSEEAEDYEPMTLVRRTITTYATETSEWEDAS